MTHRLVDYILSERQYMTKQWANGENIKWPDDGDWEPLRKKWPPKRKVEVLKSKS